MEHNQCMTDMKRILEKLASELQGRFLLEVGCGTGERLAVAAKMRWKCFGIEENDGLRQQAGQLCDGLPVYLAKSIDDMAPYPFDAIIFCREADGVQGLLYQLFSRGAITRDTRVIFPLERLADTLGRGEFPLLMKNLLEKLHFEKIEIVDEGQGETRLSYCQACGSDFMAFMHERYVPGTWSSIAEYEHLPRYRMALPMAKGQRVLDFGCGTGYGSAIMSEVAAKVTGVDIDGEALEWARQTHRNNNLSFEERDDLVRGMSSQTADLITCFEMIEHVGEPMQRELVGNFARILTDEGVLVISTPNPEITAHYDANPYHVREMTETEFRSLLGEHFSHVRILRQWISPGVMLAEAMDASQLVQLAPGEDRTAPPVAYVALCSHQPLPEMPPFLNWYGACNYIGETVSLMKKANQLLLENYQLRQELYERRVAQEESAKMLDEILTSTAWQSTALLRKIKDKAMNFLRN